MATKHPGKIVYVDGNTQQVVMERPIADVPRDMHYVKTKAGLVPIVRVVATTTGDHRSIVEYGPDGEALRRTEQLKR
ncbi:MAG: hypothetical protein RIT81_16155 [Deltaproteobacteria bacterium]